MLSWKRVLVRGKNRPVHVPVHLNTPVSESLKQEQGCLGVRLHLRKVLCLRAAVEGGVGIFLKELLPFISLSL